MRRSVSVMPWLLLAACDPSPPSQPATTPDPAPVTVAAKPAPAPIDDRIECALPGASEFARQCSLEVRGDLLVVRQPDGGFHRLRRVADDRGVIAADGSEEPNVADLDDGSLEVAIGGARYRLPAR